VFLSTWDVGTDARVSGEHVALLRKSVLGDHLFTLKLLDMSLQLVDFAFVDVPKRRWIT
jgi:hypothetical protein